MKKLSLIVLLLIAASPLLGTGGRDICEEKPWKCQPTTTSTTSSSSTSSSTSTTTDTSTTTSLDPTTTTTVIDTTTTTVDPTTTTIQPTTSTQPSTTSSLPPSSTLPFTGEDEGRKEGLFLLGGYGMLLASVGVVVLLFIYAMKDPSEQS